MYGQHIGKWPRKGFRGKGGRGCWTKAACAVHISIWQEHMRPVCIWDSDTLTNGSLGRPKPKPASKLKPKQSEFVIARLPACVCMGMGIVWVYIVLLVCMCLEKVGSVPPSHVSRSSWRSNRFKSSLLACPAATVAYCCCCCRGCCCCCLHQSSKKAQANRRRPTIIALILAIIPLRFQTGACSDDTQIGCRIVLDFNLDAVFHFTS